MPTYRYRAAPSSAEADILINNNKLRAWVAGVTLLLLASLVAFGLTACSGDGGEAAQGTQQAKAARGPGKGGERRGPSQPPVPVAVEAVSVGAIASYYTATATLAAEKDANVLARVNGVALSLRCEEGDWVRKGQTLLQIEDDQYRLRVAQAEAATASLRDRYARLESMVNQQMVSAEQFEGVKNDLAAAEAAEQLARLDLSYTTVTAPFSGRIVARMVDIGQNISVGTHLFTISDFNPLLAIVHVPAKEFKKLKADQAVELVLDSNKQRMKGRIKLVSPVIDPSSGTIKVTVEVPEYPKDTRPGDFAEVRIVTERRESSTLVPKIAVFTDRGDQIVYVAADSTAERRVVEVGFQDDENAEILSGVAAGEVIVVKGQRSLKHGAPIKILSDKTPTAARRNEQAGS